MTTTDKVKISILVILVVVSFLLLFSVSVQSTLAQNINTNQTITHLTYQNRDLGLTMQYPSSWLTQRDNLVRNTVIAFLLKENPFHNTLDFANFSKFTLAEVDLRVYPASRDIISENQNVDQFDTQGQALINEYKNSTTTLGGLPAMKITSYVFGGFTQKTLQVWTYVPTKHVLVEVIYIVQPSQYSLYLPAVLQMINSIKISG